MLSAKLCPLSFSRILTKFTTAVNQLIHTRKHNNFQHSFRMRSWHTIRAKRKSWWQIKTRRMAIANRICVSFCNQPKAQFGYLSRVMPVCRCLHPFCGWRHLATLREFKAHFASLGTALGQSRKCYMDGKRIQCLSNTSQHVPIYLQPFPSNSTRKFKSLPF